MLQNRRGAGRGVDAVVGHRSLDKCEHLVNAAVGEGGVRVLGPRFFQRETDMLTAARETRPVDETVGHVLGQLLPLCWCFGSHGRDRRAARLGCAPGRLADREGVGKEGEEIGWGGVRRTVKG